MSFKASESGRGIENKSKGGGLTPTQNMHGIVIYRQAGIHVIAWSAAFTSSGLDVLVFYSDETELS